MQHQYFRTFIIDLDNVYCAIYLKILKRANRSNNITLGNGTVAPTSGQLGYSFTTTLNTSTGLAASPVTTGPTILSTTSLPSGVWAISYSIRFGTAGTSTNVTLLQTAIYMNGAFYANAMSNASVSIASTGIYNTALSSAWIGNASGIVSLIYDAVYSGTTGVLQALAGTGNTYITCTRIA